MAQHESQSRFQNLKLDTGSAEHAEQVSDPGWRKQFVEDHNDEEGGLGFMGKKENSAMPEDGLSTPPISIPPDGQVPEEATVSPSETSHDSPLELFMQNRKTSISFDSKVKLDSGERQSMMDPLERPAKARQRGRSLLQAMAEDKKRSERAHSESERTLYDPVTGRPLANPSAPQPTRRPNFTQRESRHPLLQTTVDEMAREAAGERPVSMTSDSTLSPPVEEPETPRDVSQSPTSMSPLPVRAFSYDEKSMPWGPRQRKSGEPKSTGDLPDRQSSMKTTRRSIPRRASSRQSPVGKSPASSFLRAFSMSGTSEDGDLDREPSPDGEGQQVGDDYVLGKQIGYGGFSVIKEAWQGPGRRLAVKIVRRNILMKDESENDAAQAEFEHEVELWRFLKHKHILPLEAVYKTDFATFCFIPLNVGGTLFDLVRSNRQGLPSVLSIRYTAQLASAIRYLHEDAHVAHRDIKLENCLLDTTTELGSVRLCDFGMAEWISTDSDSSPPSPSINGVDRPPQKTMGPSDSSTSAFAGGSLEYAAPEILRASVTSEHHHNTTTTTSTSTPSPSSGYRVNPAVDIWAFGVCTYALVVGSRPFQDSFQPRVTMSILRGEWNRDVLQDKGGTECSELVHGCLTMDPDSRWDIQDVIRCVWLGQEMPLCLDEDGTNAWPF